jgi:hypothetical protein
MSYLYSVALRHVCAKHVGIETDLDIEKATTLSRLSVYTTILCTYSVKDIPNGS